MTEVDTDEQLPTVEEAFRDLSNGAQETIDKLTKLALQYEKQKSEPVTKKEFVELLRILAGDLSTVVKDTINECGSALTEAFELLADDGEDEDEEGEGEEVGSEGTIDEETVEIYITLKANNEALNRWAKAPKEATVEQYTELAKLNQGSIDVLEENFGDALKEQAALRIQAVQEAVKAEQEEQ